MRTPEALDAEREFPELVARLRALPAAAPEPLRERVRALGEPATPPRLRDRLPALSPRRTLLVLAPATLVLATGIAVSVGLLSRSGPSSQPQEAASVTVAQHGAAAGAGALRAPARQDFANPRLVPSAADRLGKIALPAGGSRLTDYQAYMSVRVHDVDELSRRTAEAMRVARRLGGYVASVQYESPTGRPGTAELVLRVPVGRVQ